MNIFRKLSIVLFCFSLQAMDAAKKLALLKKQQSSIILRPEDHLTAEHLDDVLPPLIETHANNNDTDGGQENYADHTPIGYIFHADAKQQKYITQKSTLKSSHQE